MPRTSPILAIFTLVLAAGCGEVNSPEEARRAYLGIDPAFDKAIQLGFDGFNAAKSANIDAQVTTGTKAGTLTVTGQVDQGASANKGMRLLTALKDFSEDGKITYNTDAAALPKLDMQLKSIPNGTLSGTLAGNLIMKGEIDGNLVLNLAFTGEIQPNAVDAMKVERKPGTTRVTGTATSRYGTYAVDVTR